jgi:hypothetical protein
MFGRSRHHGTREAGGTAVIDRDDETRAQRAAYEEGYADGHDPAPRSSAGWSRWP